MEGAGSSLEMDTSKLEGSEIELEEYCTEGVDFAKRTLVGKFMTERLVNRGAVKTIVPKAWGEPAGMEISDMGPNMFMFTFENSNGARDILKKSPWFFINHLLSLQYWIPEATMYEIEFSMVPFWVQIHGLPLGTMTTTNAAKILNNMGRVLEVENPMVEGKLLRSFIRAQVEVDVSKPFITGCWVPTRELPKTWICFM